MKRVCARKFSIFCDVNHINIQGKKDIALKNITDVSIFSDIDDCVGHTCDNSATCVDGILQYSCNCTEQWKGTFCDAGTDHPKCESE